MKVERVWATRTADGEIVASTMEAFAYAASGPGRKAEPALLLTGKPAGVRERAEELLHALDHECGWDWPHGNVLGIIADALTAQHALALAERDEMVEAAYREGFSDGERSVNCTAPPSSDVEHDWKWSDARKRLEADGA